MVGTYEEKAGRYVERISMECIALRGGLVGLRVGLKGLWRVSGDEPVLLEAQVRAVRGMVELRGTRNARMSARGPVSAGLEGGVVVPVLGWL